MIKSCSSQFICAFKSPISMMSTLKLYLPISASNFEKICLSKSLLCTNEELDGEIYKKKKKKKKKDPFLSQKNVHST